MKKIIIFMLAFVLAFGSVCTVFAESTLVNDTPSIDELVAIAKAQAPDSKYYACIDKFDTFIVYRYQSTLFPEYYTYELVCCSSVNFKPKYITSGRSNSSFFKEYEAKTNSPCILVGGVSNESNLGCYTYCIFEFSQNWNYIICNDSYSGNDSYFTLNIGDQGEILASTTDIIDANGNVFFSKQGLPTGLSTMGMTTETMTNQLMTPTTGLIPLVIGLVVLVMGLVMGLRHLWMVLKRV